MRNRLMKFGASLLFVSQLMVGAACSSDPVTGDASDVTMESAVDAVADTTLDVNGMDAADVMDVANVPDVTDVTDVTDVNVAPDVQLTGCNGLATCINDCITMSCVTGCQNAATASARTLFASVVECSSSACQMSLSDGGPPPCSSATDMSTSCTSCMASTRLGGAAGSCTGSFPAYCGICSSQYDACLADAP